MPTENAKKQTTNTLLESLQGNNSIPLQ